MHIFKSSIVIIFYTAALYSLNRYIGFELTSIMVMSSLIVIVTRIQQLITLMPDKELCFRVKGDGITDSAAWELVKHDIDKTIKRRIDNERLKKQLRHKCESANKESSMSEKE